MHSHSQSNPDSPTGADAPTEPRRRGDLRVDVTEIHKDGRVSLLPGVSLDAVVPDLVQRKHILSILAEGGQAEAFGTGKTCLRFSLSRRRPPEAGAAFAIRVRPKSGSGGCAAKVAPETESPAATAAPTSIAGRMAAVMIERAAETGSCTVRDLRQRGLSYRMMIRHADAARDIIAAAGMIG